MYFSISVVVTNDVAKVIALSSSDQGLALVYDGKSPHLWVVFDHITLLHLTKAPLEGNKFV